MGKKILLVEDDLLTARAIESLLRYRGYVVESAMDGEEALNKLNSDYHCVVLDIIIPKKDGLEVLKDLKNNEKTKHIPVVVCTNLDGEDHKKMASDLGAYRFVNKVQGNLLEAVEAAIRLID